MKNLSNKHLKLGIQYVIYAAIITIAFLYEVSYKAPSSVKVTLKNEGTCFKFMDGKDQIPTFNRMMFFVEIFGNQFIPVLFIYFVLKFTEKYSKITKILMSLLFTLITMTKTHSYFPHKNTSLHRTIMTYVSLVGLSTVIYSIFKRNANNKVIIDNKIAEGNYTGYNQSTVDNNDDAINNKESNNDHTPSSLIRITIKSIIFAIALLLGFKLWLLFDCLSRSVGVESCLKHKSECLNQIKKFCVETGFNLQNIRVMRSYTGCLNILALPLVFKKFYYIFITKDAVDVCPDGIAGTLYHEIGHTYFIDSLILHSMVFMTFFPIFFFTDRFIIPNLDTYKLFDYVTVGSRLAIIMKLVEYGTHVLSYFREYICDGNVISNPENATGSMKLLLMAQHTQLKTDVFRSTKFAFRRYSFFETHPSSLDRILRISEKFPELFDVEIKYD